MGTQAAMMILLHRSFSQLVLAMLVFCGLRAFVAPQERIYYGQQGSTMSMQENNHKLEESGSDIRRPVKIYVYNLPSKYNRDVIRRDPRCLNHMFATEIYIHLSLLSKGTNNGNNVYRRTWNPEEADWFYAPVYANCDLTKHGLPLIDRQAEMMRSTVHYISKRWSFWNRTEGADHFFVVPHDFGACFHFKEKAAMEQGILGVLKRATLVQTFGQRNHPCMKDDGGLSTIIVPPYVSPNLIRQRLLPSSTPRSIFAYFRGVFYDTANDPEGGYYSWGVRGAIWENFKHNPLFDLSSEHPVTYYEDMQRSLFCLCPLGWAPWSPRLVESVQMGCIPVIIADDIVMPLEHVVPWRSIAVFVKESDVPFLDSILASIPPNVIQAKQNMLASQSLKWSLLYPRPAVAGDAFHQIMKALALRLPHPPNTYLSPGHPAILNWTAGPPADLLKEPWGAIWENFKNNPLFDLSSEHPVAYYKDMQRSLFCLCPLGWAPWSPRLVQMGCIPVIIADDVVMPLEHVVPWRSIAVFIKESDVPFLDSILASIPPNVIQAKQNLLASQILKRSLLYPRPAVAGDSFHQIVKALALRLPHPPNTYLSPGHPAVLNLTAGPPADLLKEPW